ncbi:MAG: hypothetical protein PHW13_09120 [Methylococcales bacterium]|nr:hypothetical protein [Methylococcales bacterium]
MFRNTIGLSLFALFSTLFSLPVIAEDGHSIAEKLVKTQPCTAGLTVDQFFDQMLSHTHRDLGWRVFAVDEGFWVERVFMVSKGAEMRYRWLVPNNSTEDPLPVNERAQNLCSE